MDPTVAPHSSATFAGIHGRDSVDNYLRNSHHELVALNGQADFKASVIITASAVVSSIAAGQITDDALGVAAGVLVGFLLVALLAGVLAVYPKFRLHPGTDDELSADWSPLYFGDYVRISKSRYLAEVAAVLRTDEGVYEELVTDLYVKGVQLVRGKYRFLRVSYLFFLTAFLAAAVTFIIASVVH